MLIREAVSSECKFLSRLHSETFLETPWKADFFTRACVSKNHLLVVGEVGQKLSGFALAVLATDQMEILTFVVSSPVRRQGLGAALLGAIEQRSAALGAKTAFLDVAVDNLAALALYARAGYARDGVRKKYYHPDGDAILMSKSLT